MKQGNTLRSLLFAASIALSFWFFSPVLLIDRIWTDFLLVCQRKAFPEEILVINVTAHDVIQHGSERLSRKYLADSLSLLDRCNAKRVLLDFTLGSLVSPEEETALIEALKSLGPNRIALPSESNPMLRTKDSILSLGHLVQTTLSPDADGRIRSIVASEINSGGNPCAWLASGVQSSSTIPLDLRLDPSGIRRVSLEDLNQGVIEPSEIAGKLVIISIDRQISRSSITIPVHGFVDRGTVFAIGTASWLRDYPATFFSCYWLSQIVFLITFAFGFIIGQRATNAKLAFMGILCCMSLCVAFCWVTTVIYGIPSQPATTLIASMAAMKVALAHRLRINELLSGLFSGVLSPEEVWLWRVHGDSPKPAILFDAMGHIKKANQAALCQLSSMIQSEEKGVSILARKVMAVLGERKTNLRSDDAAGKVWDIHWPSDHVPIAVFVDVTEQQNAVQSLQERLCRDPLTGEANRTGFERVLKDIDQKHERIYTLMYLDMNGFKGVNDRYGHAAGDALLRISAQRFRSQLDHSDYLARLGGDEFAIVIRRPMSEQAVLELRDELEASLREPIILAEGVVVVGVAAGFAMPQKDSETTEEVVKRADLDMYQRKAWLKHQAAIQKDRPITVVVANQQSPTLNSTLSL
jgi:diguanylate cyclase (GGDEF)-like protein